MLRIFHAILMFIADWGAAAPPRSYRPSLDSVALPDWLPLPAVAVGSQQVVGLFGVYAHGTNFLALTCSGAYTVDWGDGSVQDFAANAQANHAYIYENIPASSESAGGYRQVIVRVTPQLLAPLTSINLNIGHPDQPGGDRTRAWLDLAISGPMISSLVVGFGPVILPFLRRFRFVGQSQIAATYGLLYRCYSLRQVSDLDWPLCTDITHFFSGCRSLTRGPMIKMPLLEIMHACYYQCSSLLAVADIDYPLLVDASYALGECGSLKKAPKIAAPLLVNALAMFINDGSLVELQGFAAPRVASAHSMFLNCYALAELSLNLPLASDLTSFALGCYSLRSFELVASQTVANLSQSFQGAGLCRLVLPGLRNSVSIANCQLSRESLVSLFSSLGAANAGASITITGNWGASLLSAADRAIATAKGWAIID
jgi:hypothetical protein